ncbi:MAG: outer membrane protein [Hyphomicrobiaceae bacterium]
MIGTFAPTSGVSRAADERRRTGDRLAGALAAAVLAIWAFQMVLAENTGSEQDTRQAEVGAAAQPRPETASPQREYMIAGYGGAPYTHPSDVHFSKPGVTDFTARNVNWEGRPFKSPIYYGIRTLTWSGGGPFGAMLDFTHSKTISQRGQEIELSGARNGERMPGRAKVGDIFQHFEFSHGHNTLVLNGLVRLADLVPGFGPYVGGGIGVALPHTEVGFKGDGTRTYEYQYVGPAAQALVGIELRLPRVSVFVEYKFTAARYEAPMTQQDGGWFPEDFVRQLANYWRGHIPAAGFLTTTLASHQVAAGLGVRFQPSP